MRHLGVLMTADLRFREQVDAVVASTYLLGNMILRTFAIRSASFYLNLYHSLVVPRLTYCSTIWTPFLKRDVHLLETAQRRFLRRVSARCGSCPEIEAVPTVASLNRTVDLRVLTRLVRSGVSDKFWEVSSHSRRGPTYRTRSIARTDIVNNTFAYQVPRSARPDRVF